MIPKFRLGSLLFHSTHGLCQVKEVVGQKTMDKDSLYYALVPKSPNRMSERFLIPVNHLDVSGFHPLASPEEANSVLEFLNGRGAAVREIPVWIWAKEIFAYCKDMPQARDQRRRLLLQQSLKGLIGELALVLDIPLRDAARRVRKNLEHGFKLTPLFLSSLSGAADN